MTARGSSDQRHRHQDGSGSAAYNIGEPLNRTGSRCRHGTRHHATGSRRSQLSLVHAPSRALLVSTGTLCEFVLQHPVLEAACPRRRGGERAGLLSCRARDVKGLAAGVLYLLRPDLLDLRDDFVRHRHVIKLLGHLVALLASPGEELKRLCGGH
jgi:hypothetical protein